MLGNKLLNSHFFHPLNIFNAKNDNENDYIIVRSGSINLGNKITLYFSCCPLTNKIKKIKYKVYGNPYLIASLSYMSGELINKPLAKALKFVSSDLIDVFEIPVTKKYSAYMVEDALQQAIKKWQENYDS